MKSINLNNRERVANLLLFSCFGIWICTWLHTIIFIDKGWGTIAGFFKGLVYGGNAASIPFVYACYCLLTSRSPKLFIVLLMSALWFILVRLLYWF